MKRLLFSSLFLTSCILLVLLSIAKSASAQTTLAAWNFNGKGGQASVPASTAAAGVSGSAAIGNGLTAANYLGNGLTATNQNKTTLAEAIAANQYLSFTVTPGTAQRITVTDIKIRPVSQNRMRSFALFSSQKAFAAGNQLAEFTASGSSLPLRDIKTATGYLIAVNKIHVAGSRSSIQNSTVPIEFRLYVYGHTDGFESVGIGERQAGLNEPDLMVLGSVSGPVQDVEPPSAPTNLSSSLITASSFNLSWTASTDNVGVASYEVFANDVSKGTTASTSMQVTGLTAATTYSMTVKAKDAAGNVSAASAPLSVTTSQQGTYPNSNSRMGINLGSPKEWAEEQPFKDVFKTARPWLMDADSNNLHPSQFSYDANGWITSLNNAENARAYVMVNSNPGEVYEMGQYVLLYDGTGTISFEGDGVSFVSAAPGRQVYNVTPAAGNRSVNITATTSSNHLRNIRLLPAVYESNYQDNPWRPYILERWTKFKTIRFMDWMLTNHSTQVNWTDRTTPSWYTYATYRYDGNMEIPTRSGVPLELIVDICNRLHTDAWINVPHKASDDYVRNMAAFLRDNLNSNLKIYIEYSNECWNPMFDQARYCLENGKAAYPDLVAQGQQYEFPAQLQWYSRRSVEIFNIFENVFGGTSRLVRTLAGQQANDWTLSVMLEHGNAESKTDALAVAPYFGHEYTCEKSQAVTSWTLEEFFNDIETDSLPGEEKDKERAWYWTKRCSDYAKLKNKPLLAYEGGQHLIDGGCDGNSTANREKFLAANISSQMGKVYKMDLDKWKELGGGMYCTFASVGGYNEYGYWGLLRYPKQDPITAPKYQATMKWIDDNPQ